MNEDTRRKNRERMRRWRAAHPNKSREINRRSIERNGRWRLIDFDAPPPIGFQFTHRYRGNGQTATYTLAAIRPYVRKRDGLESFVLWWRSDWGAWFKSGLKSNSMTKTRSRPRRTLAELLG